MDQSDQLLCESTTIQHNLSLDNLENISCASSSDAHFHSDENSYTKSLNVHTHLLLSCQGTIPPRNSAEIPSDTVPPGYHKQS